MKTMLESKTILEGNIAIKEYFEKRSCPELDEYANESNEAGEIRMMLYDYEMRDDKEALKENEITRRQAIRIERYIKNA